MERIGEGLKKIILAGIGAVATTSEKGQEILNDLVKKGELTVEQSKVLNKEMNFDDAKEMIKTKSGEVMKSVQETGAKIRSNVEGKDAREIGDMLKTLSKDQLAQVKSAIEKLQKNAEDVKNEAGETIEKAVEAAEEKAEEIKEAVAEKAEEIKEAAEEKAEEIADAAADKTEEITDAAEEAAEEIKD
jgi:poly(hydroxyalkanoate) granule-associated protein